MKRFFRMIRGAVGNALTWAVAWVGAGLAIGTVFHFTGLFSGAFGWRMVLLLAETLAVPGFVTGGAFSVYLGFKHRNRDILDLSVPRLALAGGVVGALTLAAFVVAQTGFHLPAALLLNGVVAGGLGAVTAGGTIFMSKHAARKLPGGSGGSMDALEREQADAARILRGG